MFKSSTFVTVDIRIRIAEEKDISSILEITNEAIRNSTALYEYEERSYAAQLKWFIQKKKDKLPLIVAESDNQVLGFGTYGSFRARIAYQFSIEHSVYVHKDVRGSGIGKQILSELIYLAKKEGYHSMIAGIDATNKGSIEFHRKFGFVEIGTFKEVGFKFNKWLDLTFMQLALEENSAP